MLHGILGGDRISGTVGFYCHKMRVRESRDHTCVSTRKHDNNPPLASKIHLLTTLEQISNRRKQVDPRRKNPDEQPSRGPVRMPVVDSDGSQKDVISRLLQDRIILLGQGVDDEIANVLVAQLLYLANEDPTKDITLYINSPGGSVSAGMAIYDTVSLAFLKRFLSRVGRARFGRDQLLAIQG